MIPKILLFILTITFVPFCRAQTVESVQASVEHGSKISDVQLLMDLDNIASCKIHLKNIPFKQGYFFLTNKEYWNGTVTKVDTLIPTAYIKDIFILRKSDTSTILTLLTKPLNDSLVFNYGYGRSTFTRKYKRMSTLSYSLREAFVLNEKSRNMPINQTIPLFVYTIPYEDPQKPGGDVDHCLLTAEGVPPEKWWEKYKVKHYIVTEITILKD